jgi:hypothetical protein
MVTSRVNYQHLENPVLSLYYTMWNSYVQAAEVAQRRTAVSSKCFFQLHYACWDRLFACFPLALSIFLPLLLWRFPSLQLFCVHYTGEASGRAKRPKFKRLSDQMFWYVRANATVAAADLMLNAPYSSLVFAHAGQVKRFARFARLLSSPAPLSCDPLRRTLRNCVTNGRSFLPCDVSSHEELKMF